MPLALPQDTRDAMVAEYRAGDSHKKIGERHGVSQTAVRRILLDEGVEMRAGGRPAVYGDETFAAIRADVAGGMLKTHACRKHGVSMGVLNRALGIKPKPRKAKAMQAAKDEAMAEVKKRLQEELETAIKRDRAFVAEMDRLRKMRGAA